jgi:hypothetical protein
MKITIIGGGPAGLYFALLMKKQDPRHEITLFERNGPDDTFGWGVVFSDKTLTYLKESDHDSYLEIVNTFETWENVDVVHKDQKITIRGNKFSGIARIELLHILQRRCLALGVDLRFNNEVRPRPSAPNIRISFNLRSAFGPTGISGMGPADCFTVSPLRFVKRTSACLRRTRTSSINTPAPSSWNAMRKRGETLASSTCKTT